jgi:hypothetical protein
MRAVSFLAALLAFAAHGCTDSLGTPPHGSTVDGGPDVVAPPNCDLAKSPKDSPACIDDSVAVFVAPSGDDGASGSKAAPLKSIAKGVELATSRGVSRIYVCEGNYGTAVEVKAAVSIFGGLSCAWSYTGAKPKLAPQKGVALRVTKVNGAVVLQDFEVVGSADASAPGDSAIAAFVSESTDVTFRNMTLTATAGVDGAKGASRSNYSSGTAQPGGLTNSATAGTGPNCPCPNGTFSKGGSGATGSGTSLEDGSASPPVGTGNSGSTAASSCTPGSAGANGLAKDAGGPSPAPGKLIASGWDTTGLGGNGADGDPAQGGGGGGARTNLNLGGGGGGCGGCGGAGGAPGTNGGSSIALLCFKSTVTVEATALATGSAGAGGAGGDGQAGQLGGALGEGVCNGGPGGHGAGGSGGGGGAGGHSVPVAYVGMEPRISNAKLTPGTRGLGGPGGAPGASSGNAGAAGMQGPDGKAQDSLSL